MLVLFADHWIERPMEIIEVQTGSYVEEDGIVRFPIEGSMLQQRVVTVSLHGSRLFAHDLDPEVDRIVPIA